MPLTSPTTKQSRLIWFALTGLAIAALIALVVAAVWGLGKIINLLSPVLWPLAVAAVVACLLSPVVDFFEKRKISRAKSVSLVFAIALVVVVGVLASLIPQVVEETEDLAGKIPEYSHRLQDRLNQFIEQPPVFLRHFLPRPVGNPNGPEQAQTSSLTAVTDRITDSLPAMGTWLLAHVAKVASGFGLLAGLALVPMYTFYFLLEKHGMETHWREYLPVRNAHAKDEILFVLGSIGQYLVAFFRGQVLVAICAATLYTIGFLIVGVNYAFLLGFMAVFLIMIPYLGAIILCLTALTLTFVQYMDWQHPVLVICVFAVVQSLESLIISPKIMGNRVGLHPLVIIIAVMTGTTLLGGILGGLLAIPLAAALRVILAHYIWKRPDLANLTSGTSPKVSET